MSATIELENPTASQTGIRVSDEGIESFYRISLDEGIQLAIDLYTWVGAVEEAGKRLVESEG